jgi:hypothetical protein
MAKIKMFRGGRIDIMNVRVEKRNSGNIEKGDEGLFLL